MVRTETSVFVSEIEGQYGHACSDREKGETVEVVLAGNTGLLETSWWGDVAMEIGISVQSFDRLNSNPVAACHHI